MKSLFICHASNDKPFVRRLKADLERYGFNVWVDENEIRVGDSLRETIESALERSDYAIIALSKAALHRPWVKREINAIFNLEIERNKKMILPVLIEPSEIPLFLRDKKYADFSKSYQKGLTELLQTFSTDRMSLIQQFETLHSSVYVEILRLDGSLVRATKKQLLKCNENVERYILAGFADGLLRNFTVSPGKIVKIWKETGLTYVEAQLPKPLPKGARFSRVFSCIYVDSFTQNEEYWEERQYHAAKDIEIIIQFLKGRPPLEWHAYERRGPDFLNLNKKLESYRKNGRHFLRLFIRNPRLLSNYVLRWKW
jgi:hypothetical protein